MIIEPIAHIATPYPVKFGVPRQPGLVTSLESRVIFEPEYADHDALRGLSTFEYIWLIWGFSVNEKRTWTPTVRPPRLGGTKRMGVFATRSSFRPNSLGLSCVQLTRIESDAEGRPILIVSGADMVDGSPIFDVKPYLASFDAHSHAGDGWAQQTPWTPLNVDIPQELRAQIPSHLQAGLVELLAQDPRPAHTKDADTSRIFWVPVADYVVRFTVVGDVLTVIDVVHLDEQGMRRLKQTGTVEF